MIITYVGLVISAFLLAGCGIAYRSSSQRTELGVTTLDYALYLVNKQQLEIEEKKERDALEARLQENRVFQLDIRITHGSAFGGCSALNSDGTRRKGVISLDQIMMFGKNPAGQSMTYYIEEQGIDLCAMDNPDTLKIVSKGQTFEIRHSDENRDQGVTVLEAVIQRDTLYYIILESKHEISIMATKSR